MLSFSFCRSEVEHGLPRFSTSVSQQGAIQVSEGSVTSSEVWLGKDPLPNLIRLLAEFIYLWLQKFLNGGCPQQLPSTCSSLLCPLLQHGHLPHGSTLASNREFLTSGKVCNSFREFCLPFAPNFCMHKNSSISY